MKNRKIIILLICTICVISLFIIYYAAVGRPTIISQGDSSLVSDAALDRQSIISQDDSSLVSDSCKEVAKGIVVNFMNWYKSNYDAINKIELVSDDLDSDPPKPYKVDTLGCIAYLKKFQESGFVSSKYLEKWSNYFKDREKYWDANPQFDGPPDGFEYDFVLFTQEIDETLASIKNIQILQIEKTDQNQISVKVDIASMRLSFYLSEYDGKWLIDNIVNGSCE